MDILTWIMDNRLNMLDVIGILAVVTCFDKKLYITGVAILIIGPIISVLLEKAVNG